MDFPCPHCEMSFRSTDLLYNHALNQHDVPQLAEMLKGDEMAKTLTKQDFTQTDSHWLYAVGRFHLSIERNERNEFVLTVFGAVEPIPPATQYPTEPEWDKALDLANKFLAAYTVARERDQ